MPIKLEFLGLDRPALLAAADYLVSRYAHGGRADLRSVVVVVPGGRAGRRLLEILVELAAQRSLILTPPEFDTAGRLPERLYHPRFPFATDLTQRLVWNEALRAARTELATLVPQPPAEDDFAGWMGLADLLRAQHLELAADGLHFGDVAEQGQQLDGFTETGRWHTLRQLQLSYLGRLDALELWDVQTARLVAVEKKECTIDRDIVLVGTVDMTVTLRRMLEQVARRVTALVFAPESWRARFDAYGCLLPDVWAELEIPVATEQVQVVEGPAEQALAVTDWLSRLEGRFRAEDIVVGVPDEQLIPDLQRQFAARGLTARWGPGQPLSDSPPVQMLRAVSLYLERGRFHDFAALARQVDISDWLARRGVPSSWLEELDEYYCDHLPYQLDGEWLISPRQHAALRAAWKEIHELVQELSSPPRKLTEWSAPILGLLQSVFGDREYDREVTLDRMILAACAAIRESLDQHAQVPAGLMPPVSLSLTIRWLLDDLRNQAAAELPDPQAIEMLGWLELPLDDAPALIVTNVNEGFVPSSVNSDLFLPNSLRTKLGVMDNVRRYARDAYALSVLAVSRVAFQLVVARRTREGDPMAPSRLLFATDGDTAARRALNFFRPAGGEAARPAPASHGTAPGRLEVPRPLPLPSPITCLSVTSFRDYLACPYRFYLKHLLRLDTIDDGISELDARAFGILAHEVLSFFGTCPSRHATDPVEIRDLLHQQLNELATRRYGRHPQPAVLVQVEQLRWRLDGFSKEQAQRAQEGWRIEHTEIPQSRAAPTQWMVDGQPFGLRGRIDRIDVHEPTGRRMIWDYKTGDSAQRPDHTHRRSGQWVDLQLPLYRHLIGTLGITGPVQLGYILLPKDSSRIEFCVAEWDEASLAEADDLARDVIRRIRREEFWPPALVPPPFSEMFAPICQDGVLGG